MYVNLNAQEHIAKNNVCFILFLRKRKKKRRNLVGWAKFSIFWAFFALGLCIFAICVFLERGDIVLILNLDVIKITWF